MFVIFLLIAISIASVDALDNGMGLTPQMGWNSWNKFACNINESIIRETTDLLISTGLAKKGYKFVNIDDCWQIARNQDGYIIEDKAKFPSGMAKLSQYVHSKGLLFGLYSDAGQYTCQKRPGGYMHEAQDAEIYAKWKVDYLKYDNCYNLNISSKIRYFAMKKALNETGRPIFYSMCSWGTEKVWQWAMDYGNSWRTTGDINREYKSFLSILDQQAGLQKYSGKGGWNDPDMLEVGNSNWTFNQYYAHFALWCILKAPLLIGCSLSNISNETLTILGNEQLIAINQDQLGKQGFRIKQKTNLFNQSTFDVWGGPLSKSQYVVAFFNRGNSTTKESVSISKDLKLTIPKYQIRDVINHKDLGTFTNDIVSAEVEKNAISVYVLKPVKTQKTIDIKQE